MFLLIVYDTERKNCVKLHKTLKRFLNWNQNSVFEGNVTAGQLAEIRLLLAARCVPGSAITMYSLESEKLLKRETIGEERGNVSNIL